jgi:hypothetical protein
MLHSAYESHKRWTDRTDRSFSPFSATLFGELAQVLYHWHQLEEAREYFSRSVEWSLLGGFSDAKIYHSVFLSRLFQMDGDLPASLQEIEKALELTQTAWMRPPGHGSRRSAVGIFLALTALPLSDRAQEVWIWLR